MPDPILYLQAMGAAFAASALVLLSARWRRRPAWVHAAGVIGIGLGLALGYYVLKMWPAWPPANALARLLWLILPAVLATELLAGLPRVPAWLVWSLRMLLAAVSGRILLHGSIYLDPAHGEWTAWQAVLTLILCGGLLASVWGLLGLLSRRSAGISLPLALAAATLCTGVIVILA